MADRWNENGPGGLDNMTAIWLPLLPPSGPAPATPAPGWVFVLDICLTAPAFLLSPSDASVTHVTTGLCVSQSPDGANRGALELAACSAADPLQRWHAAGGGSGAVTSTPHARDAGCVSWNVANTRNGYEVTGFMDASKDFEVLKEHLDLIALADPLRIQSIAIRKVAETPQIVIRVLSRTEPVMMTELDVVTVHKKRRLL
jgi:hypothetical protein